MLTLYMLWFGVVMAGAGGGGHAGGRVRLHNAALNVGSALLLLLFAGIPMLAFVLDALIATRVRACVRVSALRGCSRCSGGLGPGVPGD